MATPTTALGAAAEDGVEPLFEKAEPRRRRRVAKTLGPALVFLGCVGSIGVVRRAQLASAWPWEEAEEMEAIGRVSVYVGPPGDGAPDAPPGDDAVAASTDDGASSSLGSCEATAWAGEDYAYFFGDAWDGDEAVTRSARLRRWRAQYASPYTACNVSVARLDLLGGDSGTAVPSADGADWFTVASDAYLVVGNVSVRLDVLTADGARSYACASDAAAGGCMYWVGAGTRLRASANASATLAMLTVGDAVVANVTDGRDADPDALFVDDLSCGPLYAVSGSCSGMAVNGECPGALFDNLDADISPPFPQHYHPRGAFYYVVSGSMSFNDTGREGLYIDAGDMRFVNAAVYYGPEAGNSSTVFLSLHEPDPAAYGAWYRGGAEESGGSACDFVCTSVPGDDPLTCTSI